MALYKQTVLFPSMARLVPIRMGTSRQPRSPVVGGYPPTTGERGRRLGAGSNRGKRGRRRHCRGSGE